MNHFTKRKLEKVVLKSIDGQCVQWAGSTGHSVPLHVIPALVVGATYYLETYKFNDVGGIMQEDGLYLFHRTDEYFADRLAEYIAENKRKNLEWYEENKEDLVRRTNALSERYKARLMRFLSDPEKGEEFRKEGMGWGYELIICELAQLYERSGGAESDEIGAFAHDQGTSGNQHEVAKIWAKNPGEKI